VTANTGAAFDRDGLAQMRRVLSGQVERGTLPGLIALVARHDQVHVEVLGTTAFGDRTPMPRDAMFRVASLTKPITTDHLTGTPREHARPFLGGGGWAFCMAVPAADGTDGIPGGFGRDGGTGTTWRSDVDSDLTGILFTQRAMSDPQPLELFADFWRAARACVR
jgi:CubicO group peptidase (beta-lactamase class C family)